MNISVKTVLIMIAIILAIPSQSLKAGEPVTGLLICCKNDYNQYLVNGKWMARTDYNDIEVVRGILQNIKDAGINIVMIDMTNPSMWTYLWPKFGPMCENIRKVTKEKGMEYFVMIGAVVSDGVRNEAGMPDYIKTVGSLEFWNNQAKYIWENWATDSHYRTYGFGDDRKIINMFYPGELVDVLWNTSPATHKTYLSKFYRGFHEYNQDFKDTQTDGWGYRDVQQSATGNIRFAAPTKGLHPGSSSYISEADWKTRVDWAASAEHYSMYGTYDDDCDNINWGICNTSAQPEIRKRYVNNDPYIYYNVVKNKLVKSINK